MQYAQKNRQRAQNKMETPEIDLHRDNKIFVNGVNATQWRIINKWCWNNWAFTRKIMTLDTDPTPFSHIHTHK